MRKKLAIALLLVVMIFSSLPVQAWAVGPFQPPTLVVVVLGAPKETDMMVVMRKEDEVFHVPMEGKRRAWESDFCLYRMAAWQITNWYGNAYDFKDAELVLTNSEGEKRIPIPDGMLSPRGFNETLTIHYGSGELSYGLPAWRAPLLISIRLAAVLLVEGLIFFLKGYSRARSWLMFVLINLVIHGLLNVFCNGWIFVNPDYYTLFFIAIFVSFVFEIACFLLLVDEGSSDEMIDYLIPANLAGHITTMVLMRVLPL